MKEVEQIMGIACRFAYVGCLAASLWVAATSAKDTGEPSLWALYALGYAIVFLVMAEGFHSRGGR